MKNISAIIIADSIGNLDKLTPIIVQNCTEIVITGHGKNMEEASEIIKNCYFDIIFLDIDMGGDLAFQVLENSLTTLKEKELIMLSTHKDYAMEAFKYGATDFLLKPLSPTSVLQAIEKAKKNRALKKMFSQQNTGVLEKKPIEIIAIPSLTDIKIIPVHDIIYLESDGRYTIFHTSKNQRIVSSKNLGIYEKLLLNNSFLRIHHSYLVNMNFAVHIQKKDGLYVEIPNKKYLSISKRKVESLYEFLSIR